MTDRPTADDLQNVKCPDTMCEHAAGNHNEYGCIVCYRRDPMSESRCFKSSWAVLAAAWRRTEAEVWRDAAMLIPHDADCRFPDVECICTASRLRPIFFDRADRIGGEQHD